MQAVTLEHQLEAARTAVLVVPAPELGVLVVTGADRMTWLNGLVTCDLLPRKPGEAVYGLTVAKNGRVQADLIALVGEEELLVVTSESVRAPLHASFEHYLIMEDAEVAPADREVTMLYGPRAAEVLEAARAAGAAAGGVHGAGLEACVVVAPRERAADVRTALQARVGQIGGALGDAQGYDVLRLEHGIPRFGVDFDGSTYPQEAGLEGRAVSFSKGCYLGQEVVFMLEKRGHVKRKLVPLVLEPGGPVPARGAKVNDGAGMEVGEVSSAVASPSRGRPVALAMVKRAYIAPGTRLQVDGAPAEVTSLAGPSASDEG